MNKKEIFTVIGSSLVAGLSAKGIQTLTSNNDTKHDPELHPGEGPAGVFVVAGEVINFLDRTHDGKPMSDVEYNNWKDILKPHIN